MGAVCMKIAIIGTHGVGKTTLAHMLASYSMRNGKNTKVITEVVRDCPFPINDKSSVEGGYWISSEQIARELKAQAQNYSVIICDRSAIDPVMYLHAHDYENNCRILYEYCSCWMHTYDAIIWVRPDKDHVIIGDGFRDTDTKFQKEVDLQFEKYVHSRIYDYLNLNTYELKSNDIFCNDIDYILDVLIGGDEWTNTLLGL